MGSYTSRITWEPLRSIDSATFTGVYLPLGTQLANPSYICKVVNNSTMDVLVSIDGVTAVDIAPAGSFWLYDETKFVNGIAPAPALPQGTQIYVNGSAGTGSVYLVTQYLMRNQ